MHDWPISGSYRVGPQGQRVHVSANVAEDVTMGRNAEILEGAFIGPGSRLAEYSSVGRGAVIGTDVYLGASASVGQRVTVGSHSRLERDVRIGVDSYVQEGTRVPPGTRVAANSIYPPETEVPFQTASEFGASTSDAHALLSLTHSDTVPAAPLRGALVKGNASSMWERFDPAAGALFYDGTDLQWRAIQAGDLPGTYVPTSRVIAATSPLRIDGGGSADLSADRTLSVLASDLSGTTNQVNLSASGTGVLLGSSNITLSLPQDIHTGASPTFAGLTLSSATPSIIWNDTDQAADERRWDAIAQFKLLEFRALEEDGTPGDTWLSVQRGASGATVLRVVIPPEVAITSTTASTSAFDGALVVHGGMGLQGALYTGGVVNHSVLAGTGTRYVTALSDGTLSTGDISGAFVPTTRTITTTSPLRIDGGASADLSADRTLSLSANGITNSLFRQSAGFSVVGKATTGTGEVADIVASADQVLRRSGSGNLAFGTLVTNNIGNSQVTYAKIQNVSTNQRVLGRNTAGAGVVEEVTAAQILGWAGGITGSGTTDFIPKFTSSGTLGNSKAFESTTGITVSNAADGSVASLDLFHTSGANAANHARVAASTVAGGGDPFFMWSIAGGGVYHMGADNSASGDPLFIGAGTAPGTTPFLSFTSSGDATFYQNVSILEDKVAYFGDTGGEHGRIFSTPGGEESNELRIESDGAATIATGGNIHLSALGTVYVGPLAGSGTRNVRVGALGDLSAATTSTVLDDIGSTRGSLLYRGASAWAALTPGAANTVLISNGAGADPSYASLSSLSIPTGTGAANRGAYWTGTNTLSSSANFTFDGTNATFGGTLGVTELITASGGAEFSGGTAAEGTIVYTATNGLQIRGKAGTNNDFRIVAAGGTVVARLPVGTANLNFDTRIDAAGGIAYTGGTAGAGRIVGSATSGLILRGQTGSSRDFTIQAADGTNIIQIPVGAATLTLSAPVTISGSNTLAIGGGTTATGMVTGTATQSALTYGFISSAGTPAFGWNRTGNAADEKIWDATIISTGWALRTRTDAGGAGVAAIFVSRGTGTAIGTIDFGNTSSNPTYRFLGSGTSTFSGPVSLSSTLTGSGSVWINSSNSATSWSSDALMQVSRNGRAAISVSSYSDGDVPLIVGRKARGTFASPSAVQNGNVLLFIGGHGHNGTTLPDAARVAIQLRAIETFDASSGGTETIIETTPTGSTTRATVATFRNALITLAPPVSVTDATDASSSTTGSLKTAGGLGVAKKVYVGDNTEATSTTAGSTVLAGGLAVAKRIFAGDWIVVNSSGAPLYRWNVSGSSANTRLWDIRALSDFGSGIAYQVFTALADNQIDQHQWLFAKRGSGDHTVALSAMKQKHVISPSFSVSDAALGIDGGQVMAHLWRNDDASLLISAHGTAKAPLIEMVQTRGTYGSQSATQANDILGGLFMYGHNGTGITSSKARFYNQAAANWTGSTNENEWVMYAVGASTTSAIQIARFGGFYTQISSSLVVGENPFSTSPKARIHIKNDTQPANLYLEAGGPIGSVTAGDAGIYISGNKLVIQSNDGGTIRYKYLDLTGTGVTWTHTTSAP